MAEGIGVEVQLYLFHGNAELVPEIPFGIKDMPGHAFQRRQVLVQLHKRGTGIFPASFLHTGTNPLKQLRVIILSNAVHRSLGLGKCEVRILVHQVQHGAEGVQRHIHRFMEAPHPVHINVGMGHTVHGHGLGGFRQGQQHFFRLAAHGIRQRVLLCPGLIQNVHRLIQESFISSCFMSVDFLCHGDFGKYPLSPVGKGLHIQPVVFLLRLHPGNFVISSHFVDTSSCTWKSGTL